MNKLSKHFHEKAPPRNASQRVVQTQAPEKLPLVEAKTKVQIFGGVAAM